jgi:signal peptidase I
MVDEERSEPPWWREMHGGAASPTTPGPATGQWTGELSSAEPFREILKEQPEPFRETLDEHPDPAPPVAPEQLRGSAAPDGPGEPNEPGEPGEPSGRGSPEAEEHAEEQGRTGRKRKHRSFLVELPFLLAIALGLALLIKAFVLQAFFIPSGSMENTLQIGDRVLVNKVVYHLRDIHRGEIIVFNGLDSWTPEGNIQPPRNEIQRIFRSIGSAFGVAPPGEKDFIKRVVGVPGDTVFCCDVKGRVTVNGVPLHENYLFQDDHEPFGPVTVPKGRLWVMGDHRGNSADSRAHTGDPGGGTVPADKVIGRAFVIVWPPSHFGTLSVPKTFQQKALSYGAVSTPYALGLVGALPLTMLRRRRKIRTASRRGRHAHRR